MYARDQTWGRHDREGHKRAEIGQGQSETDEEDDQTTIGGMARPAIRATIDYRLMPGDAHVASKEAPQGLNRPLPHEDTQGHEHQPQDEYRPAACAQVG